MKGQNIFARDSFLIICNERYIIYGLDILYKIRIINDNP